MTEKRLAAPYGDYSVDSSGTVWSHKGDSKSKVASRKDKDGYPRVNLSNSAEKNGFKDFPVHELVAKAFLGARPEGAEILHKNSNRSDASAKNLKYGSKSENATQREKEKKERSDALYRIDAAQHVGDWKITPEGYLEATAVVARVGNLEYLEPDGSVRIEYVTPEALMNGVETLVGKPLTFEHPPERSVTARNFRKYAVGIVQDAYYDDATQEQVAQIIVHDEDTIERVMKEGIREVSPGYFADMLSVPGEENPLRQIRREHNHVAITKAGRGGPESAIRLDSKGHVTTTTTPKEDKMDEKEMKEKLDAALAEKADMQKKLDAMSAKVDAFEKMASKKKEDEDDEEKKEEEAKNDSVLLNTLVAERMDAMELAESVGASFEKSFTNDQIKEAICAKALGEGFRCDSKEALQGMYDAVKQMTPKSNSLEHLSANVERNDSVAGDVKPDADLFSFYDKPAPSVFFSNSNEG